MSVHIGSRVLSLGYVSFRQIRALASPFPPVGAVAAPCGSPAVPHLRRYYGVVRLLAILPCPLRSSLGVHVPPHAGDIFFSYGRRRWRALLGSWAIPLETCHGLGTPATPAQPRLNGRRRMLLYARLTAPASPR